MLIFLSINCSKSSNSPAESNNLSGTKWVNNNSVSGLTIVETITFTSATSYTDVAIVTGSSNNTYQGSGTYKYNPPNIVFTINSKDISGTINGNYLYAPSLNGTATTPYSGNTEPNGTATITYVKQ